MGGSLCQADPSERPVRRVRRAQGVHGYDRLDGSRACSARGVDTGPYETVVGPAELLTEIRLPVRPGSGSAYLKVMRRAGDWPIGAAWARRSRLVDGLIADVGIGLTAVGAAHFVAAEARSSCAAWARSCRVSRWKTSFSVPVRSPMICPRAISR